MKRILVSASAAVATGALALVGLLVSEVSIADDAEAYWAASRNVGTQQIDAGRLVDNLACLDTGVPSGGTATGVGGPALPGVNDLALVWTYPPQLGVTIHTRLTLNSDGGYGLAQQDWRTQTMMANGDEPLFDGQNTCGIGSNTPCSQTVGVPISGTTDVAAYLMGASSYSSLPAAIQQDSQVPGMNQARWGIAVNPTIAQRAFQGTIAVWAEGPGGWTGGSSTNPLATYSWVIQYPKSTDPSASLSDQTGSVTCTRTDATVDITVGRDSKPVDQYLAGSGGTWADVGDGVSDSGWGMQNLLPGESFARATVINNVGSAPVTLDMTIASAQSFGLIADAFVYTGDQSAGNVAINSPATPVPNDPTTGAGSPVNLRQGICDQSLSPTQLAQAVTIPVSPAASLTTGKTVTLPAGSSVTVCMVVSLASATANGDGAYLGAAAPSSIQGTIDSNGGITPSLTLQVTATGTGSTAGITDTAIITSGAASTSADYIPSVLLPNNSMTQGQCTGSETSIPYGQPFMVAWGDAITNATHGVNVDHYQATLRIESISAPDTSMDVSGKTAGSADTSNPIKAANWRDDSWVNTNSDGSPLYSNVIQEPAKSTGLAYDGMVMIPPNGTANLTTFNTTASATIPLGATSPTPPTGLGNGAAESSVTYYLPNNVTGIGWALNVGNGTVDGATQNTDPNATDALLAGDIVTGTMSIVAVGPGGWTSDVVAVQWRIYGTPGTQACLIRTPTFDMMVGPSSDSLNLEGPGGEYTDASWSLNGMLPGDSLARQFLIKNNGDIPFDVTGTIALTSAATSYTGHASTIQGLTATTTTYTGDATGTPAAVNTTTSYTPLGGVPISMSSGSCDSSGSTLNVGTLTQSTANALSAPITIQPGSSATVCVLLALSSTAPDQQSLANQNVVLTFQANGSQG